MQSSRRVRRVKSLPENNSTARWAPLALPVLVVLGSFLGGSTQRWSEGIVLAAFGLLLLARPPRFSLGPALNLLAVFFLALAACAFLPAHWFYFPAWRIALTRDFGVVLPATLSAQPWLTLDCSITLLAGLAWIYYVATLDVELRDIRAAARIFAGGMIGLGALCILLHLEGRALPFWHNVRNFGPYPNRNQTGDLFGISILVVLACMQEDFRRDRKRWIVWLAGVGVLIAALILDFSRAGILILVLGMIAWLGRLAFRKWTGGGVAVAFSLLLILFAGLLLFGGETLERFHLRVGSEEGMTSDYRWLIFRDAWTMIKASPWAGLGVGNFESVFALFRAVSRGVTRSHHPESDWLWLWSEMGWLGVALTLAGALLFVRRVFPLKEGTNQRFRYAALIGLILFLLHGLVDVSAHRWGTFLAGTFLLGLAQLRPFNGPPARWPAIVFRFAGVIFLLAGLTWFFAWRRDLPLPGRLGVENAKDAATFANRGHRFSEAVALSSRGLEWAPLDWQLYFIRGAARIGAKEPARDAVADFRRARFLEPSAWEVAFEEGRLWLGTEPTFALSAWREALRRRTIDPGGLYSQMLALAKEFDPRVLARLGDFATDDPGLTITYLENLPGTEFPGALQALFARDPTLAQFHPAEKTRLFALWSRRDSLDDLVRAVAAHPEWTQFAWPGLARWHAGRGEFAEAWGLVRRYAPPPVLPSATSAEPIPALEQKLYADPQNYAVGYALYRAQAAAGKTDDALATIRHFTAQPGAPAYFYYLQAEAWAAKENWERAWQAWRSFVESERKPNA